MVSQATTDDGRTTGEYTVVEPTARRPSVALDAFTRVVEADGGTIDSMTRSRACEALATNLRVDDIRQTDFVIRYREPTTERENARSPAGTLLIDHPVFPDSVEIAVTSVHAGAKWNGKHIPGTLWSVFHPMETDILPVAENKGCEEALEAASERLAAERERHSATATNALRRLKQRFLG